MKNKIKIIETGTGKFFAISRENPEMVAQGNTENEAIENFNSGILYVKEKDEKRKD